MNGAAVPPQYQCTIGREELQYGGRPAARKRAENHDENCHRANRILYKGENLPWRPAEVLTVPQNLLYNECSKRETNPGIAPITSSVAGLPHLFNTTPPQKKQRPVARPAFAFPEKRNPESGRQVFAPQGNLYLCGPARGRRFSGAASPFFPRWMHKGGGCDRKGLLFPGKYDILIVKII